MKAIVYEHYGPPDAMELCDFPEPEVRDRDVLVRVRAASIGAGDWHLLSATWFAVRLYQGLLRPKRPVLGHDLAGTVEAVGAKVTRFRPGDEVLGSTLDAGCFAELCRVREDRLVERPEGVTPEQAAALPSSGCTALEALRDHGRLPPGGRVLVNGASGGVGTFAVQLARHLGAGTVTGVCSAAKADLVSALGADFVLDYTRDDYTARPERYDLVIDNVGNHPFAACRRVLTPGGVHVAVSGAPSRGLWMLLAGGRRMKSFISRARAEDVAFLADLVARGELEPSIDRVVPLEEVPAALTELGAGRVRGKLVVRLGA
jgi:NADPH:quinone reductase-like Zn-dependent oxidoreductase